MQLSSYINYALHESGDTALTAEAVRQLEAYKPDFAFLFLADTDNAGHKQGWMSEEYTVIIMADHGGHDRTHGADIPEDMTIPLFFCGKAFTPGAKLENASLLDLTPTIADVMGIAPDPDREGKPLTKR